ncbi:MAG: ACT domain-containing protein [Phycisphaerae bacterium]
MQTQFPNAYVLNIMADDHPGIVSAVSSTVTELGGNIDTASQTVVGGYFTLLMVVSLPEPTDPGDLAAQVAAGGPQADPFQVVARPYRAAAENAGGDPIERFVITAFGKDKPGIIARFSGYLAGKDINITDFFWSRSNDDFTMISQLEVPRRLDLALLQADLEELAGEEGFTVKLQHENVFVATNQLRLTRTPIIPQPRHVTD